jgi:hypothetical protein
MHLIVCQDSGSYPVHDMKYERQIWDRHWVFNYTHTPGQADILGRNFFDRPAGATVDPQGNMYVVDSGENRKSGALEFSKAGLLLYSVDERGYRFIDNRMDGGPAFNWIELNPARGGNGVPTGLGLDSDIWVNMGLVFNFYEVDYDSINISSNGWCNFLEPGYSPAVPQIPSQASPNGLISAYGQHLNAGLEPAEIFYWHDIVNNLFVVQYDTVFGVNDSLFKTFELILKPADSSITFQFQNSQSWNSTATVGVENRDGTDGVTISTARIGNGYSVKFFKADPIMRAPGGITYDIYGDRRTVYIADTGNNRILRYKLSTDLEH